MDRQIAFSFYLFHTLAPASPASFQESVAIIPKVHTFEVAKVLMVSTWRINDAFTACWNAFYLQ